MLDSDQAALLEAISVETVLGPVVLGICFNAFVYGFSVLQFVQYRTRQFPDSFIMQLLIFWTFLIDTVHTVALCWMLWAYVIDNFTNPAFLLGAPWPFTATPIFLVLTCAPIHFYYAHRVWGYSQSRILYWIIITLSLADIGMGITATVVSFTHPHVDDFKVNLPVIDSWLAVVAVCDGVISVALIYYLVRRQSAFRRHESFKYRLANTIIESSFIPAIFALADLIIYSCLPLTNFNILMGYCLGRMYTCNLLALANSRLKQQEDEADGIIHKESSAFERRERRLDFNTRKGAPPEVEVNVCVHEESIILKDEPSGTKYARPYTPDSDPSAPVSDHKCESQEV